MSDRNPRTGTTQPQQVDAEQARRAADQQAELQRQQALREATKQGQLERIELREDAIEDEAEDRRQEITRQTRAEERADAWRRAPGHALLLILIFLICYLIAAAIGRPDIISFPRTRDIGGTAPLDAQLDTGLPNGSGNANTTNRVEYVVAPVFSGFYTGNNGQNMFGAPISGLMELNGRQVQWFQRARLEYWPEFRGTRYEWQLGRLGAEFTQNVPFPNQTYAVSNQQCEFARISEHAMCGRFRDFWLKNGGLDMFGHPISDEVQELLADTGQVHTVQYFERARLEYHPENAGTPNEVMLGLLGSALYLNDSAPNIISAAKPTPVPVPVP